MENENKINNAKQMFKTMSSRKFLAQKDPEDVRDYVYQPTKDFAALPSKFDLSDLFPEVYDQGQLGSCVINAVTSVVEFSRNKQGLPKVCPSKLYVYYNYRVTQCAISQDIGSCPREAIRIIKSLGYCSEDLWPYSIEQFRTNPSIICYETAESFQNITYSRLVLEAGQAIKSLNIIKECISSGSPIIFSVYLFESFCSSQTMSSGIVIMPKDGEKIVGSHGMVIVGYDESTQMFKARNSWGKGWGQNGYCMIPYDYMLGYAEDFWTIAVDVSK